MTAFLSGVVAEFTEPDAFVRAVITLRRRGYRAIYAEHLLVGVEATDPSFDGERVAAELLALGAVRVTYPRGGRYVQTEIFARC